MCQLITFTAIWNDKGGIHCCDGSVISGGHILWRILIRFWLANPARQIRPRGSQKPKKSYRVEIFFQASMERPTDRCGNNIPRIVAESSHPTIWGLHSHGNPVISLFPDPYDLPKSAPSAAERFLEPPTGQI